MQQKNFRNFKIKFELDYHKSLLQRFLHIGCLIFPIISTVFGYFIAVVFYSVFFKTKAPELISFITSIIFFIIAILFIFFKTKNTNSVIEIKTEIRVPELNNNSEKNQN